MVQTNLHPNSTSSKAEEQHSPAEKIVASATKVNIIIADQGKKAQYLGANNQFVPVEVIPFALSPVKAKLAQLGGKVTVREAKGKLGPISRRQRKRSPRRSFRRNQKPSRTQHKSQNDPRRSKKVRFFVGLTDIVYLGTPSGVEKLVAKRQ